MKNSWPFFSKVCINLFLCLTATLFAFLLAEILFRTVSDKLLQQEQQPQILLHQSSPNLNLLYHPIPNAKNEAYGVMNTINSLGFRGDEISSAAASKKMRIIFLGDSVVYGYGLADHETIPFQLEQTLKKNNPSVEVLNLGVSGYDTLQEVEFLKKIGRDLKPNHVILGYTLNDSIYASMELDFFHDKQDLQVQVPRQRLKSRFYYFLFNKSHLMKYLDQKYALQIKHKSLRSYRDQSIWHYLEDRNKIHQDPLDSPYQKLRESIEKDALTLKTTPKMLKQHLGFVGIGNDEFWSSHWNLSYVALEKLSQMSKKDGFQVTAVIFPYMADLKHYPLRSVHLFLTEQFSELGFNVIDLLESTQLMEQGKIAYSNDPIHYSVIGAKEVATAIGDKLELT